MRGVLGTGVVMAMTRAGAALAHVPIVRRRSIGRLLRVSDFVGGLRGRFRRGGRLRDCAENRRRSQ